MPTQVDPVPLDEGVGTINVPVADWMSPGLVVCMRCVSTQLNQDWNIDRVGIYIPRIELRI